MKEKALRLEPQAAAGATSPDFDLSVTSPVPHANQLHDNATGRALFRPTR